MNTIKQYLFGFFVLLACVGARAQEARQNSITSMTVAQQAGTINVKLTFAEALAAVPPGFSVARPARIAFDFFNTTNGLGKNSQTYNEGDLKSANIIQADGRTRLVLNLNRPMTYETTLDGSSLVLALTPSIAKAWQEGGVESRVEHFAQARPSQTSNSIRDIAFRRGKDGEARITVDMTDANAGIDIRQQGANLVVDFNKVVVPEALRKKLDVTDFATPVVSVNTTAQGAGSRMTITPRGLWEHNAYQTDNQFVIEVKPVIENPNKLVQGTRGGYQGEKLSLNFQNVDVRRLLQVIRRIHRHEHGRQRFRRRFDHADPEGRAVGSGARHHHAAEGPRHAQERQRHSCRAARRDRNQGEARIRSQGADRRPRAAAYGELPDELRQGRRRAEASQRPETDAALEARQRIAR